MLADEDMRSEVEEDETSDDSDDVLFGGNFDENGSGSREFRSLIITRSKAKNISTKLIIGLIFLSARSWGLI